MNTVILADGDFPASERTLTMLRNADRIICCDGAAVPLLAAGLIPERIVGDLDSLPLELKERYADRLLQESEQESNDLTKAFRYCQVQGYDSIVILGATGKREDHTLGNLALLGDYALSVPEISMVTDYGTFSVALTSGEFASHPGERISLFALDEGTYVTSSGLRYPMDSLHLRMWWQASLNEAEGESFRLDFTTGKRLLIYRIHPETLYRKEMA